MSIKTISVVPYDSRCREITCSFVWYDWSGNESQFSPEQNKVAKRLPIDLRESFLKNNWFSDEGYYIFVKNIDNKSMEIYSRTKEEFTEQVNTFISEYNQDQILSALT